MGAGVQRWWRGSYFEECEKFHATRSVVPTGHGLVRCVDEDGIECRLRLYTYRPMYYGTFKIS